ncbi:MAG: hypothetical protein ACK4IS_13255 [Erythrobacter sp.]
MPVSHTYSLHDICHRLAHSGGDQARITYLRSLIADYGFPQPYPTFVKGKGAVREIRTSSRWPREAVDAWFIHFDPPATLAADELARQRGIAELHRRAGQLTLVGGTEA